MAYDENLADRIRRALEPRSGVAEKKMFGGLAFLLEGRMFIGIAKDELMVRVGPEGYEAALAEPHVRPMDFTGRPMNGYVFVGRNGCRTDDAVKKWIERAATFVATLASDGRKTRTRPRRTQPPRRAP